VQKAKETEGSTIGDCQILPERRKKGIRGEERRLLVITTGEMQVTVIEIATEYQLIGFSGISLSAGPRGRSRQEKHDQQMKWTRDHETKHADCFVCILHGHMGVEDPQPKFQCKSFLMCQCPNVVQDDYSLCWLSSCMSSAKFSAVTGVLQICHVDLVLFFVWLFCRLLYRQGGAVCPMDFS
jgi:hypothetical protein